MIWINIRTVAAEIYLAVSDIPQMSGSVFFPHKLETVFGKIYLTVRLSMHHQPASFGSRFATPYGAVVASSPL